MLALDTPPAYRWKTPWLNRLGAQPVRTILRRMEHKLRPVPACAQGGQFAAHFEALDRDGIAVVPNFLPAPVFAAVLSELEAVRKADSHRRIRRSETYGLSNWSPIVLPGDPVFAKTNAAVRNNPTITALVEHVIRRRIDYYPPAISFLSQRLKAGATVADDPNAFLHGDVHYPTCKAVIYLNDVTEGGGPFVYCYGSHRVTWARLGLEHRLTRDLDLYRRDPTAAAGKVTNGAPTLTIEGVKRLGYDPRPVYASANTLIVADHFGMHSRGELAPGRSRDTLRLSFRYLEAPRYRARHLLKLYHRLRGVSYPPYENFDGAY